jgi:hypothetical protein
LEYIYFHSNFNGIFGIRLLDKEVVFMIDQIKTFFESHKKLVDVLLFAFVIGITFGLGYYYGSRNTKVVYKDKEPVIKTETQTETKTVIQYVPKVIDKTTGTTEKTDEKYVFDKDKIQLDQKSTATVDIKVPVIDKSRRWSAGIGYGNYGLAGKIDFPIGHAVGGWIAGDRKTVMAGISVNF